MGAKKVNKTSRLEFVKCLDKNCQMFGEMFSITMSLTTTNLPACPYCKNKLLKTIEKIEAKKWS